jgi:hypothetical protein
MKLQIFNNKKLKFDFDGGTNKKTELKVVFN